MPTKKDVEKSKEELLKELGGLREKIANLKDGLWRSEDENRKSEAKLTNLKSELRIAKHEVEFKETQWRLKIAQEIMKRKE